MTHGPARERVIQGGTEVSKDEGSCSGKESKVRVRLVLGAQPKLGVGGVEMLTH